MVSTYVYGEDFAELQTEIQQVWDANSYLDLVDIESIDDTWTAVFEDNASSSSLYISNTDFELFQEEIVEQWDRGYEIVDLEQIDNTWVAVFKDSNRLIFSGSAYSFAADLTELEADIQER